MQTLPLMSCEAKGSTARVSPFRVLTTMPSWQQAKRNPPEKDAAEATSGTTWKTRVSESETRLRLSVLTTNMSRLAPDRGEADEGDDD